MNYIISFISTIYHNSHHYIKYIYIIESNRQAKDELQWIAVWQLLYHLQHLARYKSRLQLILGIVIVLNNVFISNQRGVQVIISSCTCYVTNNIGITSIVVYQKANFKWFNSHTMQLPHFYHCSPARIRPQRRSGIIQRTQRHTTVRSNKYCAIGPYLRFLSYYAGMLSQQHIVISRVKLTCLTTV